MDRRQALRLLGAALTLPVVSRDLFAFGQEIHAQLPSLPALRTLDAKQNAIVTTMAELIIPATETPGAKAARVNEFIDVVLTDWLPQEDRALFLAGLAETDARSRALFAKDFVDCDERQQTDILSAWDEEVARLREALPPDRDRRRRREDASSPVRHFFFLMKRFTLIGYYTSEIGAQQELHFEIIPTHWRGCVPLEDGTKAGGGARPLTVLPARRS